MSAESKNTYPKLHNATWPGLVGKGGPDAEPVIEFEAMLGLTAAAEVDGQRFDGVDIFLSLPHTDIDDWSDKEMLYEALGKMTSVLRPWVKDFHVAQNDATVKGSGSHDKTGCHCLPNDPNGKMDIARAAGLWLRNEKGEPTRSTHHINWDGCMFSNDTMTDPQTWNNILSTMIAVRNAHGWN